MNPNQNKVPMGGEVKKSKGPIIGIIVIVIILVLGAFYVLGNSGTATPTNSEPALPSVSSADDVNSIQADLNAGSGSDVNLNVSDVENSLK